MERVTVFIDGFNLYYGLRAMGWRRYYWLNIRLLSEKILLPQQALSKVHYFTARVVHDPKDPDKRKRQKTYLDAIRTLPDVNVHYGAYKRKNVKCLACGNMWRTHEEKMTDVNIAVEIFGDAVDNNYDTAIVVSADGDLVGPITAVRGRYPNKRIVVAFLPKRFSNHLRQVATGDFTIGRKRLKDSQLSTQVVMANGNVLTRPPSWK